MCFPVKWHLFLLFSMYVPPFLGKPCVFLGGRGCLRCWRSCGYAPPWIISIWAGCRGSYLFIYVRISSYSIPLTILYKLCGYGSIPMKIPFLVGWTSINPSYFDVNYRGTIGFDTLPCIHLGKLSITTEPCSPELWKSWFILGKSSPNGRKFQVSEIL